jgi:hypothetical protein
MLRILITAFLRRAEEFLKKAYDDEGKHYSANITRFLLCLTPIPQLFFLHSNCSLPNSPLRIIDKSPFDTISSFFATKSSTDQLDSIYFPLRNAAYP